MHKIVIISSMDGRQGDEGTAIAMQVVEFATKDLADAACAAVAKQDDEEGYTQIETVKLYTDKT